MQLSPKGINFWVNSNGWDIASCVYNIALHAKEVVLKLDSLRACKASFTYCHASAADAVHPLGKTINIAFLVIPWMVLMVVKQAENFNLLHERHA